MMNRRTTAALALVAAFMAGGMIFQAIAQEQGEPITGRAPAPVGKVSQLPAREVSQLPARKVFQLEMATHGRWIPTLIPKERKEAARVVITAWFKAIAAQDLEAVVERSGVPFWMDGNLLDSEKSLRADFKRQLGFVYVPKEFEVEEDFSQVARSLCYPMNGMLLRVSDGARNMRVSVRFGKATVVVGVD